MMTNQLVARFERNTHGRDFVVGDIHGAISMLDRGLAYVGFNLDADRVFSVGDLIDRGPESHRVAELLKRPWFHAVRGNHEQMLLQAVSVHGVEGDSLLPTFLHNGLGWWLDTPIESRLEILQEIEALPVVIEVATWRGNVGLVHADVPRNMVWQFFVDRIEENDETTLEVALWSRDRIRARDEGGVPGIGRVFVGHTPQVAGVERLGNVYFVDTGAVFGEHSDVPRTGLSIVNLVASTNAVTKEAFQSGRLNLIALPEPKNREFSVFGMAV